MSAIVPRYPVYVISKGRADCCLTAKFLREDRVPFRLVVEPQERDEYIANGATEMELLVAPFSNLGLGSIPVRNFVWEHSRGLGCSRHWVLDDNIKGFWRRWKARRIRCVSGPALYACEAFVDRYENVGVAGLNYYMFSPNKKKQPPFYLNVHVYSCLLIRNDLPYRWRGWYNEDTDLCLRVLSGGLCTVLLNAFLCQKMTTMTMKGGNSQELYKGDGRLVMSRSLERAWPGVVETTRKFQRPQHKVKGSWRYFDAPLIRKAGVDPDRMPKVDNFGIELVQKRESKSPEVREMIRGHVKEVRSGTRSS